MGQRRRRLANGKTTLFQCILIAGIGGICMLAGYVSFDCIAEQYIRIAHLI